MIHAFAVEPKLAAGWSKRDEFRFIHDKFGLGTPRVLLELPEFTEWKNAVYSAAAELDLTEKDWSRLEEVFRLFSEQRCRRADAVYSAELTWLENAEREYVRRVYRAILAIENPRRCAAVVLGGDLGFPKAKLWMCEAGVTCRRMPEELAAALYSTVTNCRELHLVDPHFGPENARHRKVLEALLDVLPVEGVCPHIVRVHCSAKSDLAFFEQEARKLAARLPVGAVVEFARWEQKANGEKLHNRYVLTDLGGVSLGIGLDAGSVGETDDLTVLSIAQYQLRWSQYVGNDGSFIRVDTPATIHGTKAVP